MANMLFYESILHSVLFCSASSLSLFISEFIVSFAYGNRSLSGVEFSFAFRIYLTCKFLQKRDPSLAINKSSSSRAGLKCRYKKYPTRHKYSAFFIFTH